MRIFTGGIITETNTFSPIPTGYDDFVSTRANTLSGSEPSESLIQNVLRKDIESQNWTFCPSFIAVAEPGGTTVRKAYEQLRDELLDDLKKTLPLDIAIFPLHGAMVAEGYDDCEADIIERARAITGPDTVIGVELDLHCHLSQKLVDQADLIAIYREYPHTDILDRARELLAMCIDCAEKKTEPVSFLHDSQIINLYPTTPEPMRSLVEYIKELNNQPGIISVDIAHGFPWGDVEECGTRVLVTTNNDQALAEETAKAVSQKLFEQRHPLQFKSQSMPEAFLQAREINDSGKPVVMADVSDNSGGGAPGDSTYALKYLVERQMKDCLLGMIYDPQTVAFAMKAGAGATLKIRVGGKTSIDSGQPVDLEVRVVGCIPDMQQSFPQSGSNDIPIPCGDSVCLEHEGIHFVVNSIRTQVFSPEVFTQFGISLNDYRIIVVKSIFHFHAAFAPLASKVLLMSPPGALNMNFTQLPYTKVNTNKFPWKDIPE
ncbi:microcystin LR degradation protein MlrC-like protein [Endozoicomonas sp. OPT23]|uniref:M81 family metallopeptidase n=1 Tax=Endozoicomonas sp. OPT23 TaxID=2072845 RepID=UPI00129BE3E2|nr:M81 family metallopeptidase [Endozoicomonas sp. OPT23]MRI31643.1 microcystin LR degradation protein MlrC-like protein [Endozoicomonas sp. OPT23]